MSDEHELYGELTKLNNELANATRELARKNAQLLAAKQVEIERARLIEGQNFASSIAHMINNIMMKISGSAQVLGLRAKLDADGQARLNVIHESIAQSSLLIDRLLLITDFDQGPAPPVDLDCIVNEVIDGLESDTRVSYQPPGDGMMALAHASLVRTAVQELIDNAIEAVSGADCENGEVKIRTSASKTRLVVAVSDNGPGVDPEIADRVFEAFVTTRFLGRGLGLTLARHAANGCNGELSFGRRDGITTFRLALPLFQG